MIGVDPIDCIARTIRQSTQHARHRLIHIKGRLLSKKALVNQSKHEDTPFDIWDSSVKEHMDGDWEAKVRTKIRNADIVCVLCGEKTHTAKGVAIELQIAKDLGKPYFLLNGYKERACTKPTSATTADKIYDWTWDNLKKLIHGSR